ncbi:MAG: serpin family protein [Candidatus Wallbacteria bacterium HGW-Wallbacteria-1]|jgi:serpin B|uniref:Serpin family protein n=1 Tax=Candidatus Wallbacteria bacterium HGW-Wallbacteria-1 TaxID=2013854 RepID=A0A2N1PNI5_9BACT|nr:MAG: serpin family protein [Candidatus Wallbacteria bacterium HGW-Wallbacteria-1]
MHNKIRSVILASVLLASVLLPLILSSSEELAQSDPEQEKALVRDNSSFAIDLYQNLKNNKGNIFFSPCSISTALAMTYGGARGNTEKEMAKTLKFSLDPENLHNAFAQIESRLVKLEKKGHISLKIANSLWPQKDYEFLPEYQTLIRKNYGVTINPVDFVKAAEDARITINTWVEMKTQNKIRQLIPRGVLDELTRLVLVNAIYFRGNWASQFKPSQTIDNYFHESPEKSVPIKLMFQKNKFRYGETRNLQILELPYQGNELSMLLALPKKQVELKDIEKTLTIETLQQWRESLAKRRVRVYLPKFKITALFRLDQTLISMGMADAFNDSRADFSGMDGRPHGLCIGAVLHKAFVEVNEEGTEAAAATAVVMNTKGGGSFPPVFKADHPFIFLIQENMTGNILFMGRFSDPAVTEK